jgi:hypothetical protein
MHGDGILAQLSLGLYHIHRVVILHVRIVGKDVCKTVQYESETFGSRGMACAE